VIEAAFPERGAATASAAHTPVSATDPALTGDSFLVLDGSRCLMDDPTFAFGQLDVGWRVDQAEAHPQPFLTALARQRASSSGESGLDCLSTCR